MKQISSRGFALPKGLSAHQRTQSSAQNLELEETEEIMGQASHPFYVRIKQNPVSQGAV